MIEHLTGIVLAAGLSRRAAPRNKLLLPFEGRTVVRATTKAMCGAGFREVIVVTGHDRAAVEQAVSGLGARCVHAADFALGMGSSLAAGVCAAAADVAGFAITPGDLPRLDAAIVRSVAKAFAEAGGSRHVVPTCRGERGHPVVVGGWLRALLEKHEGASGAKDLLAQPGEIGRCLFVEIGQEAIAADVDRAPG